MRRDIRIDAFYIKINLSRADNRFLGFFFQTKFRRDRTFTYAFDAGREIIAECLNRLEDSASL
jgi:hypothetical protein